MSSWMVKLVTQRIFRESHLNKFGTEDPYYEETIVSSGDPTKPDKVKKIRKRTAPKGLSENDEKIFIKIRRRAYHLDMLFNVCGIRVGWNGIISLLPVVGDALSVTSSLMIYKMLFDLDEKVPLTIHATFLFNILIDFLIGLIPIVGSIVEIGYKANSRNSLSLEKYLEKVGAKNLSQLQMLTDPSNRTNVNDSAFKKKSGFGSIYNKFRNQIAPNEAPAQSGVSDNRSVKSISSAIPHNRKKSFDELDPQEVIQRHSLTAHEPITNEKAKFNR
ncbi:unnamed protein product [Kuraishia capsulata CBS 1993]|uniref:PH domain-containing protein n=1 Tax=Kuraishia capsulata CBS 1993 TaxID=1382522 RepID=W6MW27_9ASCO|nr:uncharacterized protein KUCA_T00002804001 [Kuraishia capsulata CBS 1993]CDK26830.1 unnamed protein product [Kuraishia capsulata CBS 1993]